MRKNIMSFVSKTISVLLISAMLFSSFTVSVSAEGVSAEINSDDPFIVVSLGDSYSSGEGIPPFYGQDSLSKFTNEDWLAHRSTKSWSGLLKFPEMPEGKTLSNYKVGTSTSSKYQWYFKAASGATTDNFLNSQKKTIVPKIKTEYLPPQLSVFNGLTGKVDYVTLTIGGNDVDFAGIITNCVLESSYLVHFYSAIEGQDLMSFLDMKFLNLWNNFSKTRTDIKNAYIHTQAAAGLQAQILVAGYPKLLDKDGKGAAISKEEANKVNENVHEFNKKLQEIIGECQRGGLNIDFVDVEKEFDKDGGHQAYSGESWINPIWFDPYHKLENVNVTSVTSDYSIHPNERGAQAYADCINNRGTLSGKICKASDRTTPVANARIEIYKDNVLYKTAVANASGNYSLKLPEGQYLVKISADGYIDFKSYASVAEKETTYMETFLMVEGEEGTIGTAQGRVINSLVGTGVEGVTLTFKDVWNSIEDVNGNTTGEVAGTAITDENGNYTVDLPLGNYTAIATKDGFVTSSFNIIVQEGTTGNQNGTITPVVSGDSYLITLTWGENPRDLDSHVVGTLSNNDPFHVFYGDKSKYDGDVEVCNLDYDDTSSYGPEHITLKPTTDKPYYYYVYRYAGSGTVASSEAKVTVHQGNNKIAEFNVPTNLGNGDYWNVFAIVNGQLVIKNTITSNADTGYATPNSRAANMLRAASLLDDDAPKEKLPEKKVEETVVSKSDLVA